MLTRWSKLLSREGVDLTTLSAVDLVFLKSIQQFAKGRQELFFTYFEGKTFTHYIGTDAHALGQFLYKKYFKRPAQIQKYYHTGLRLWKKIESGANLWSKRLEKNPNDCAKAFKEFKDQFTTICSIYSIISYLSIESWQKDFDTLISNLIKRNKLGEVERERIHFTLYRPWRKTAILKLQEQLIHNVPPHRLLGKYQFLRSWAVVWYRPIEIEWIQNMRPGIIDETSQPYTQAQVEKLLRPSSQEWQNLSIAPYIIFFKDWRDDLRRFHAYSWSFMFEKLADKFGCQTFDLGYLTLDEMAASIRQAHIPKEKIAVRKQYPFVLAGIENKLHIFDKMIPERYRLIREEVENKKENATLNGIIAHKGKVIGEVVVISSFHDIKKVKDHQILVANTTHPNYLPAMQRAAAFVTNEGGTLSHAAILARELKKPCIIGTKIATRVLKDGDMVEVDAELGTIRKL